jgi:hypothetical protein
MVKVPALGGSVLLSMIDNGFRVTVETTTPAHAIKAALGKSFISIVASDGSTYLVRRSWIRKVTTTTEGAVVHLDRALRQTIQTLASLEVVAQVISE